MNKSNKGNGIQQHSPLKNVPPAKERLSRFERLTLISAMAGIFVSIGILAWQLHDSHKQMRLNERAWIGLQGVVLKNLKAEQPIIAEADFTNSGKSPALNVTWDATLVPTVGELEVEKYAKSPKRPHEKSKSQGIIVPDAVLFIPMKTKPPAINAPGIEKVRMVTHGSMRSERFGIRTSSASGTSHTFVNGLSPSLGHSYFVTATTAQLKGATGHFGAECSAEELIRARKNDRDDFILVSDRLLPKLISEVRK